MIVSKKMHRSNETLLLKYLGASPTLKIIDFFLDNPLSDYSKNEIVRDLEMSRLTFFKFWKELEESGAVRPTRKIGRATMFRLDRENEVVKQLVKLDMTLSRKAMEKAIEVDQKVMTVGPQAH
jgi:hypothetical protein